MARTTIVTIGGHVDSFRFLARCASTDLLYNFVYSTGDVDFMGRYLVGKVDPLDVTTMPAWGIVVEKKTPTECIVQYGSEVTVDMWLIPGKPVFIGLNAMPTQDPSFMGPIAGATTRVQSVGTAISARKFLLVPAASYITRSTG